jgi:hypothetical protein
MYPIILMSIINTVLHNSTDYSSQLPFALELNNFCTAELRFLLLFLEKEERYTMDEQFLGGKPPNPPGSASRKVWGSRLPAKQNNAFCFFFL